MLLHIEAFAHNVFFTQELFTERLLHREHFSERSLCPEQLFTRDAEAFTRAAFR